MQSSMIKQAPKNLIDQTDLLELVSTVIKKAEKKGASAVDVGAAVDAGYTVSVRLGDIDTVEYHRNKGIDITVFFGHHKGVASTTDFSPEALEITLDKACYIARYTGEDPCHGLPPKQRMAFDFPTIALYFPWELSVENAITRLQELEALAMGKDSRIQNSEGSTLSTNRAYRVLGNSHGFLGGLHTTRHSLSVGLVASEGDSMERESSFTTARAPEDLRSIDELAAEAAERTVMRLKAKRIPTQKAPIIFDADIAPSLIGHFISAISGGALYRKASFLLDHLGQPIFPEFLTITEQPHLDKGLGSAPYDQEGVLTQERALITHGILQDYVLSHYSAQKLGRQTTGNAGGIHNLWLSTTDPDQKTLLKKMQRGLLVTELIGHGINLVNGDYSRGAFGYWVEHGEIIHPVSEITIAGNLKTMFQQIIGIGADFNRNSSFRVGSILIAEMTIAGL